MFTGLRLEDIRSSTDTPKTQLVIVVGILVLSVIFDSDILMYVALGLGVLFLVSREAGYRIVWGWYKLAEYLGWFNSRVLLSLVYYIIVTPIGILFRLFGNDPLLLKKPEGSFYSWKDHTYKKEDLENPW